MTSLIQELATQKKIAESYTDAWGKPAEISEESKKLVLKAMGYAVDDPDELARQVASEEKLKWTTPLEPVYVERIGEGVEASIKIRFRVAKSKSEGKFKYRIQFENATRAPLEGEVTLYDKEPVQKKFIDGEHYFEYELQITIPAILGYHTIELVRNGDSLAKSSLIIAPIQCYKPDAIRNGKKIWGPSIQLYALRSESNWGVGDFGDLANLIEHLAAWGAGFVGLNPIHALYPANPESASPYSPSSRRWLNVAYINVEEVPEYINCSEARNIVASDEFQNELRALRAKEYVDYTGVLKHKLRILRIVFDKAGLHHKSNTTDRSLQFKNFFNEGGESLQQVAIYDALQQYLYNQGENAWGWPVWEEKFRKYSNPEVMAWAHDHEDDVYFYAYLQFIADEQLSIADAAAKRSGMTLGIYRDLAVGVSEGSAELWANAEMYCPKASVGCPPDVLGPNGQNWGLPPFDPNKLYAAAYRPIIDLYRSNMKWCGALRIDHAMSLLRLWWVPPKESASKGAYIYYNVDDMLGILALESVRHKCLVIGEDLGTVPEIMKKKLPEAGIYSYKIFFFETSKTDGGYISPKDYTAQAMSALTTHDMPTLKGFWHCEDLKLGRRLGLYKTDEIMNSLMTDRLYAKQRILDSLNGHGILPQSVNRNALYCGMSTELNHCLQIHMCLGNCAIFSTQLEDWLEMDKPVNIPGTSTEYPNWRRKLSRNINDIFSNPNLEALARRMTAAREQASGNRQ